MEFVNLFQGEQKDEAFKLLNPAQTVPTLVDDGFSLYESAAIVRYLSGKMEGTAACGYPVDPKTKAMNNQFISWAQAHIKEPVNNYLNAHLWKALKSIPTTAAEKEESEKILRLNLTKLEAQLVEKTSLCGTVSLCDLVIVEELLNLELLDYDFGEFVNIQQWMFEVQQNISSWTTVHKFFDSTYKPAIQKAMKK